MSHLSFYRKYRSQTFESMVGQEHIIQTLQNAITHDRLAQAYIFAGPRGTGKTSAARIFAKALNCRKGKSMTPCLECDLCQKITQGHSVDVIEIDAASNTGVDNIRALNDQINFRPVECEYKLYIIDEAHMLSTGAFNALLKTIEEPPANTIFILATTEPQKIPATIHSRCQCLHFRKLSVAEIVGQLSVICQSESIQLSPEGLTIVAKQAGGCMRDAISLLDQLYSWKGAEPISQTDIYFILGNTQFDTIFNLVRSLIQHDGAGLITQLNALIESGANVAQLINTVLQFFKNLLLAKLGVTDAIELDPDQIKQLSELAGHVSLEHAQKYLDAFARLESESRYLPRPELALQVRLLTLLHTPPSGHPSHTPRPSGTPLERGINSPSQKGWQAKPDGVGQKTQPVKTEQNPIQPPVAAPASPKKPPEPSAQPAPPPTSSAPTLATWPDFLVYVRAKKPSIYLILNDAQFVSMGNGKLAIRLTQSYQFFKEKLEESATRQFLKEASQAVFGTPYELEISQGTTTTTTPQPVSTPDNPTKASSPAPTQSEKAINDVIALFEGTIV